LTDDDMNKFRAAATSEGKIQRRYGKTARSNPKSRVGQRAEILARDDPREKITAAEQPLRLGQLCFQPQTRPL